MKISALKAQIERAMARHNPESDAGNVTLVDALTLSAIAEILTALEGAVLTKVETCQACQGEGHIKNPLWEEFEQSGEENPYAWFEENHPKAIFRGEKWWQKTLPPVHTMCQQCAGEGVVKKEVVL